MNAAKDPAPEGFHFQLGELRPLAIWLWVGIALAKNCGMILLAALQNQVDSGSRALAVETQDAASLVLDKNFATLERELRGQLNAARSAATQEWIAYAHVAGGCNLIGAVAHLAVAHRVEAIGPRVGNVRGEKRVGEVGMVQDVEEFRTKLQAQPLGDARVLEERQVPLLVGRADQ